MAEFLKKSGFRNPPLENREKVTFVHFHKDSKRLALWSARIYVS